MDYFFVALVFLGCLWTFIGQAARRLEFREGLDSYRAGIPVEASWTTWQIEGWMHGYHQDDRFYRVRR